MWMVRNENGFPGRRKPRRGLFALAGLAMVACSAAVPGNVRLSTGNATMGSDEHRAVVSAVTPDSLTVQGTISTPTPCYSLISWRTGTVGNLEIRIIARPTPMSDQACAQAIAQIPYTAVTDVSGSGSLRLRVVHAYQSVSLPSVTVLDTTVVVP
jgi:hypothetical protein